MKRKRLVVMGFMGSCPIAGVIWQHIHYIVGLQRLGHDVYYIEDSARLPYNPETFEVNDEYDYAARLLARLAREFGSKDDGDFAHVIYQRIPRPAFHPKRIRQLYREADAILNVCGTQEFNEDLLRSDRILYIESDPGVEQIKIDKRVAIDRRVSAPPSRPFHLWRERRPAKRFSGARCTVQMAGRRVSPS